MAGGVAPAAALYLYELLVGELSDCVAQHCLAEIDMLAHLCVAEAYAVGVGLAGAHEQQGVEGYAGWLQVCVDGAGEVVDVTGCCHVYAV